jgi:hypothetical protein
MTSPARGGCTLFGLELPYNVADLFLSNPEEFFWVLYSKLGLLRIYSTDPWSNQIARELEGEPASGRASTRRLKG